MSPLADDFRVISPAIAAPGRPVEIRIPQGAGGTLTVYRLHKSVATFRIPPDEKVRWSTPSANGAGYILVATKGKQTAWSALDVSSSWTRYPRYGFLSEFGPELEDDAESRIQALAEFRVNAVQFYDWHWRHEMPVSLEPSWRDLAGRSIAGSTVRSYILAAHAHRMKATAYNLIYGSFEDGEVYGVRPEWMLYQDSERRNAWAHPLPRGWQTPRLRILDPANEGWRALLFEGMRKAMTEFGFDGWHADQLGDPGPRFNDQGTEARLDQTFNSFLRAAKAAVPGALIFNNVSGYGLRETADAPVDFLYIEVWDWATKDLQALGEVVRQARALGKQVVIAAYLNSAYQEKFNTKSPGKFNSNSYLTTEATILAHGGWKLGPGDEGRALCHEYFPNRNLVLDAGLKKIARNYAHFAVAYQELLRGPGVNAVDLEPVDDRVSTHAEAGKIWQVSRGNERQYAIHLINLVGRTDTSWRDLSASAEAPVEQKNVTIALPAGAIAAWVVSPDRFALPERLAIQNGKIVVPKLSRWTMVYAETSANPDQSPK